MRPISDRFKAALKVSHKRATEITCTPPGGDPIPLRWTAGNVSSSKSTGVRYQANLTLAPTPGLDTFGLISTPGAVFRIKHGIDFGAGDVELVDCGVYETAKGATKIGDGAVALSLVDQWCRVDRDKFLSPYYPESGTRASKIVEVVTGAMPGVATVVLADGGIYEQGERLWDRSRPTFITDMADDGALDVGFDASGAYRIRAQPILDPKAAVWTFRTGEPSNIDSAERERPFDKRYNMVVMEPLDGSQSWDRQIIILDDPDHPMHPDKFGDAQFFYKSPTLDTPEQVTAAGVAIMQRFLGTDETISIGGRGNPALEVGDVVTIVHEPSGNDVGLQVAHIIDSFSMDLRTGGMSLATRSTALADLQEA